MPDGKPRPTAFTPATLASVSAPQPRAPSLLRHRDFLLLWSGQGISQFGSLVGKSAIDFAAIATLGASPYQVATLGAVGHIAGTVGAAIASSIADRLPRRPVMIASDLGRALLTGGLTFTHLLIVATLIGVLTVIFEVSASAYLPTVVSPDEIVDANGKISASGAVAEVAGFGIAGWLVQWLTAPIAVAVDGISFIASAVSLWQIRAPEPRRSNSLMASPHQRQPLVQRVRASWKHAVSEARIGLRTIGDNPVLRAQFVVFIVDGAAGGIANVTIVLYMIRGIGFEPGILTMIWAIGGITSFASALMVPRIVARFGAGRTMSTGLFTTGVGTLLIPLATGPTVAGAILLILNQIVVDPGATAYSITSASLQQSIVPNDVLGRVSAVTRFAVTVATVAGMIGGGIITESFGMRVGVAASGIGAIIAGLILATGPAGRLGPITVSTD
ncbi:MAG: MFS transporter [Chloroflexi bacterium]|nr:MFS transporter [Chloroflexota bacterium]